MSKRKTTLRNLEQELTPRAPPRTIAQAQSFDHGLPIRARFTTPAPQRRAQATAFSQFVASWSSATEGVGAYEVESFDLPLPLPLRAAPRAVEQSFMLAAPRAAAPRPPSAPVQLGLQEIDDELAAIRAQTGTPPAPPEPPLAAAASVPTTAPMPETPLAPPAHAHDVFDSMGRAMRYANTFDLGAIELRHRFDQFDREIARDEVAPRAKGFSAGASSDDVEEDLRMIGALAKLREPLPASSFGDLMESARQPAPAPAPAPAAPPPEPVVRHEVALIAEQPGLSGDAACAAMILAWKYKLEANAAAVLEGRGGWSQFREALSGSSPMLLNAVGFELHGPELPNTDAIRGLLERSGPVWIGAPEAGVRGRVITGLSVEPTRQQALLHIADSRDERTPAPDGAPRATTYTVPFMQFIRSLPENATGWILAYLPVTTGT